MKPNVFGKISRWLKTVVLLGCVAAGLAAGAQATDSLHIQAGYYGCPMFDKGTYPVSQLQSLGTITQTFTHIDAAGRVAYAVTTGVPLSNILAHAGISTGDVKLCHFDAVDNYSGGDKFGSVLFDTQRYAYTSLSEYYGMSEETFAYTVTDPVAVQASAVPVTTVLAVSENYAVVDEFTPYDASCYSMRSDRCLRLFYGQAYPTETNASTTIHGIYGLQIYYYGSPTISAGENELTLSVGEDYVVDVTVGAKEQIIAEDMLSRLKWQSSEAGVISVDANGRLTVHKKGEATIQVTVDGYRDENSNPITATVKITVNDEENLGTGGDGEGGGAGNGAGAGSGDGESQGDGDGNTGAGEGTGDNGDTPAGGTENGSNPPQNSNQSSSTNPGGTGYYQQQTAPQADVTLRSSAPDPEEETQEAEDTDPEDTAVTGRPLAGDGTSSGGQSGGGGSELELVVQQNYMELLMLLGMLLLMAAGGAVTGIRYKKEI